MFICNTVIGAAVKHRREAVRPMPIRRAGAGRSKGAAPRLRREPLE